MATKKPRTLSLLELLDKFPTEESAEQWLIEQRWPDGEICCPKCGSVDVIERKSRKPRPFRCRDCRRYFRVKTDSLMHSSPLSCRQWVIAMYLFHMSPKGISSVRLAQYLGIQQKSAWHMLHRLRENFVDKIPALAGIVEVDEAHIGGRFKVMHAKVKRERRKLPNYGKTIVAGARERPSGRFVAAVVPGATQEALREFIEQHVAEGTWLYTDESSVYDPYERRAAVNHGAGQYTDGNVTINGIESLWATFKRAYWGTYHWVSAKHLQRYLNECCGRLNLRGRDTLDQLGEIVRGLDCKRLAYRDLVA